jgi:hypothetical protein
LKLPRLFQYSIALLIVLGLFGVIAWAAVHGKDAIVANGVFLLAGLIGGFGYGRSQRKKPHNEDD